LNTCLAADEADPSAQPLGRLSYLGNNIYQVYELCFDQLVKEAKLWSSPHCRLLPYAAFQGTMKGAAQSLAPSNQAGRAYTG
jgi:hypothetical protein